MSTEHIVYFSQSSYTHLSTLPDDLMPLIIARQTAVQAASRQMVMREFNWPISLMVSVMSRALRNQKYVVGELLVHSFTMGGRDHFSFNTIPTVI